VAAGFLPNGRAVAIFTGSEDGRPYLVDLDTWPA
jgi:hypothetical protein